MDCGCTLQLDWWAHANHWDAFNKAFKLSYYSNAIASCPSVSVFPQRPAPRQQQRPLPTDLQQREVPPLVLPPLSTPHQHSELRPCLLDPALLRPKQLTQAISTPVTHRLSLPGRDVCLPRCRRASPGKNTHTHQIPSIFLYCF